MKAAISGSSGFIGSHLVKALSDKNWEIVKITQEVLYSPMDLRKLFQTEQPDYIYHLAAYGNMSHQKDIAMIVMANIIGTFNMLNESQGVNYKAFIQFGSSSEYGKKSQAMSEKDITMPDTFYGAAKVGATNLAHTFAKQFDKPITTIRPFSVYGSGEADFRFIPTVCRSLILDQSFNLDEFGNHDWIYISDFIDGLFTVQEKINQLQGKIVNIGTGRMHSNKEIVQILEKIADKKALAVSINNQRPNDSEVWMASNQLLTSLGWYPKVMLQEGLQKTFDYYKEKYAK